MNTVYDPKDMSKILDGTAIGYKLDDSAHGRLLVDQQYINKKLEEKKDEIKAEFLHAKYCSKAWDGLGTKFPDGFIPDDHEMYKESR